MAVGRLWGVPACLVAPGPCAGFSVQVIPGYITCLGCEATARPPGCQDLRPLEHCAAQHQAVVAGAPRGAWLLPIRGVLATSLATHIITHTYCLRMPLTWNDFKGSWSWQVLPLPWHMLAPKQRRSWHRAENQPWTHCTQPAGTTWHCPVRGYEPVPNGGGTCLAQPQHTLPLPRH